jgi:hypothetical protein
VRHVIPLGAGGRDGGGYVEAGTGTGGGVWRGSSFIVVVRRVLRFFVEMLNKVVIVL